MDARTEGHFVGSKKSAKRKDLSSECEHKSIDVLLVSGLLFPFLSLFPFKNNSPQHDNLPSKGNEQ